MAETNDLTAMTRTPEEREWSLAQIAEGLSDEELVEMCGADDRETEVYKRVKERWEAAKQNHRMQQGRSNAWCRDCGRFSHSIDDDCPTPGTNDFDLDNPENVRRVTGEIFGAEAAND